LVAALLQLKHNVRGKSLVNQELSAFISQMAGAPTVACEDYLHVVDCEAEIVKDTVIRIHRDFLRRLSLKLGGSPGTPASPLPTPIQIEIHANFLSHFSISGPREAHHFTGAREFVHAEKMNLTSRRHHRLQSNQ
jgi:hypothetical protein